MFRHVIIICVAIAVTLAKPSVLAPVALEAAPLAVAAPIVRTAHSSQYSTVNHHAFAAPVVAAAPLAAPLAAPVVTRAVSGQYSAVNHNTFAAPFVASAPLVSSYAFANGWSVPQLAGNYIV